MVDSKQDSSGPLEACERFADILDGIFAEEKQPSDDDRVFLEDHKGACPSCRVLADALEELESPDAVHIDAVKRAADSYFEQKAARRLSQKRLYPLVAAAAVLLLAVSAVFFAQKGEPEDGHLEISVTQGALLLENSSQPVGETLDWRPGVRLVAKEETLLTHDDELTIGLKQNSRIALTLQETNQTRLHLISGEAVFELEPAAARSLIVETAAADVVVTGTVFSVKVLSDDIRVHVKRGSVRVEPKVASFAPIDVKAGQFVLLSRGQVEQAAEEKIASSAPADNAAVIAAEKTVQEAENDAPSREDASAARHFGDKDASLRRHQHRDRLSLGELIRQARQCRTEGRWACAAQKYKSVAKSFPSSPERLTVLVPLAEIELDKLGQPGAALRHYREYLAQQPDGALAPEAYFGKCRAYETLGRADKEYACLRDFLQKFPKSIHARSAKRRLVAISGSKK